MGVLVDEAGFFLEVRVLLASVHEVGQFEVVMQHHLTDQVINAVVILSLMPDRGRTLQVIGKLILGIRAALLCHLYFIYIR